jgi:hypothetical protein
MKLACLLLFSASLLSNLGFAATPPADLTAKGAKFTETKGVVTAVDLPDLTSWTDSDFAELAKVKTLNRVGTGKGLNDHTLPQLTALSEVTSFGSNGADLTDEGVKLFAKFPKLQTIAFFHPGKNITGTTLGELASLKSFDNLTVGGSNTFGDEGMAAIGKLTGLKNLRIYHSNVDGKGLVQLKNLKNLTSLLVGQRLAYTPPVALSDDTIPILLELPALESLTLNEARLKYESLAQLKQLKHLKRLTLDSIDLTQAEVDRLGKELPGVQIKFMPPNEAGLKRISALFGAKH